MNTVDDITLLNARRGDRDAQSRLLRAMQDDWYRFCLAQLRVPDRAEDATQETALRVLRSLVRFDGRSSLKTWTFGIALNVCREMRRQASRSISELGTGNEPTSDDPTDAADAALDGLADAAALRTVLAGLPQRQREVVTLRYLESMSVQQTAEVMQCAQGTVKATLFAALRTLRGRLTTHAADRERAQASTRRDASQSQ